VLYRVPLVSWLSAWIPAARPGDSKRKERRVWQSPTTSTRVSLYR